MAARDNDCCHVQVEGCTGGPTGSSPGGKRNHESGEAAAFGRDASAFAATQMAKKARLHVLDSSLSRSQGEGSGASAKQVVAAAGWGERPRLPSPIDVADVSVTWGSLMGPSGSQPKTNAAPASQAPQNKCCIQTRTLPPTLRGISDAARVLITSRPSTTTGVGKENQAGAAGKQGSPLLLSFPTESVYVLACCVKTASSKSVRDLLSRADSHASLSSSSSFHHVSSAHQDSLKDSIHQPNASLELMLRSNDQSMPPSLFVCDKHHALNYCHFTKPKTFAIRPPSFIETPQKENTFCPLPVFGSTQGKQAAPPEPTQDNQVARLTPKITPSASPTSTAPPITPNNHKLCAANFSESREAFLRLASKFWPGPVAIHVQARMLGGILEPASQLSETRACSSSILSLPSLPSIGDLMAIGSSDATSLPVLPTSVLIPASRLLEGSCSSKGSDRFFVGMQCPSHPLPRKILQEVYRGTASSRHHSPSSESLGSMSPDENADGDAKPTHQRASSCKLGRARSSIAVVGRAIPGMRASAEGAAAVTAVDVGEAVAALSRGEKNPGRIFVVDGEDTRESFSVPTCQYGGPHPVSLVIDGENRTVHLVRRQPAVAEAGKETTPTKDSVYRALLKAMSPRKSGSFEGGGGQSHDAGKEKKGDGTSIDRVITAVLSRWKILESTIDPNDVPSDATADNV